MDAWPSGRIRRPAATQTEIDTRRQLARLAAASNEERLWGELKGVAQAFEMTGIRVTLAYRGESDSMIIQREHGDLSETAGAAASFEANANSATIKVELRAPTAPSPATIEGIKQATECACARIHGKPAD